MGKKTAWILLLLLTFVLMVSCSDGTLPQHTTETLSDTTQTTPQTTTEITQGVEIEGTPTILSYTMATNHSEDGISVPSASFVSGTLIAVNDRHCFRYNVESLPLSSKLSSSVASISEQNLVRLYGKKSHNYLLVSSRVFLKADAFQPWEDLMAAFVADTGKKTVQVVSAYVYNGEEYRYSSFVTGYSIAVNLYENGANYSMASSEKKVTVNGITMTYLDWFLDHCVQYGFVYTGLTGDQANTLATFRYVGVPHALAMQTFDYVDTEEYTDFLRSSSQICSVVDSQSNITWSVFYCSADKKETLTKIALPKGAVYTVSGDNVDGFIVAYYMPES